MFVSEEEAAAMYARKLPGPARTYDDSGSSKVLASFKSCVSNPSVDQPKT